MKAKGTEEGEKKRSGEKQTIQKVQGTNKYGQWKETNGHRESAASRSWMLDAHQCVGCPPTKVTGPRVST
jgi:hypothetical protein